jgi:hypothetical protein
VLLEIHRLIALLVLELKDTNQEAPAYAMLDIMMMVQIKIVQVKIFNTRLSNY